MSVPLIDHWTAEIHREFHEHRDTKSGLSQDCSRCRDLAMRLFHIQTEKLLEIDLIEWNQDTLTLEKVN